MPNTILKRWNGTAFEELYPKTTVGQISASGTANSTTFLRGDGQWATPAGGSGTVTSVSGTGSVSGLTLSGTVTTSGSLTLGGTLSAAIANITGLQTALDAKEPLDNTIIHNIGTITNQDWNTFIDGTEASWVGVSNHSGTNRPSSTYTYGLALNASTASAAKFQLYAPETGSEGNGLWYRTGWNTTYRTWVKIWDSGNDGTGSTLDADLLDGNHASAFVLKSGSTMTGSLTVDTSADFDQTAITSLTSAPIVVPEVNVGSTNTFLPFLHQTSLYSAGYRTHMNLGLFKQANGWGDGETGFYVGLGGNDSNPTQFYKMTYGGAIKWINNSGTTYNFWSNANHGASSGLDADLLDGQHGSYYASLASPALTGTPTAPTATAGTNTTQIATTAFVSTAVANLINSAPGALDTLDELAAALGDDANFASTVTNALAGKASTVHTHTASEISDSGNVGRNLLTTSSATASTLFFKKNPDHTITLEDAATFRTSTGTAAASHTHSAADVTSGTLVVGRGGTGTATAPTAGGIIWATSTSAYASTALGTSGQFLQSAGTSTPVWANLTTNITTISNLAPNTNSSSFSVTGYRWVIITGFKHSALTEVVFQTWVDLNDTNQYSTTARTRRIVWNNDTSTFGDDLTIQNSTGLRLQFAAGINFTYRLDGVR